MKNKRFYKTVEELPNQSTRDYAIELFNYLKENATEYFNNPDNKATDMRDFETWPDNKVDRDHLVMYGELMLVDLETAVCDHAYVICQVTKGRHKLASGRVVHLKPIESVIPVDTIRKSNWRNGYFLLPILPAVDE